MSEEKYVYMFEEGNVGMKELLGGKGANLAEMTANGFPVPYGFTITTEVCSHYYANEKTYPEDLDNQMLAAVTKTEEKTGKKFGDPSNPLLVSVRSGAPVSMPGMMDTVLNLGLNDEVVEGLVAKTGNDRFVWDSYRRFITMFGDVVMGVKHADFEKLLEGIKEENNVKQDNELTTEMLKSLVEKQKALYKEQTKEDFPTDAVEQLKRARDAVFGSWNIDRAVAYRRINHIPAHWGTAVNVQEMVFGNMGETSGTGVAFTRDPATGENIFYGEFLMNAQGEDVVAGIRTPLPIAELASVMPHAHEELVSVRKKLEEHYKEMQDFEFTIEDKKLYILQTRTGKRTGKAAVKIAVEMVGEGLITKEEGVLRVDPNALDQLLHKQFDPDAKYEALTKALPASPGAAVGEAVFTAEHAKMEAEEGKSVILVRVETSPEDIEGMHSAQGILTARGGMTSHAAVVARGMGKCCVAGAEEITVDEEGKKFSVGDTVVKEGDIVSLNGTTGEVIVGEVPTVEPSMDAEFETLMGWADEFRTMKVRTNADTPEDAKLAREFGAEGIGLIRTEHMFFDAERIKAVREMILAKDLEGRKVALAKIEPFQIADFEGIFEAMDSLPVIIRMLDPPLHEFLPKEDKEIDELAVEMGVDARKIKEKVEALHDFFIKTGKEIDEIELEKLAAELDLDAHKLKQSAITLHKAKIVKGESVRVLEVDELAKSMGLDSRALRERIESLHEFNPMLGFRGCRLALVYPEIMEMQVRAILTAAKNVRAKGKTVIPEIEVPLVGNIKEFTILKELVDRVAKEVGAEEGSYSVGTMFEVPRAALTADEFAKEADFISFGTNDLTQMTCGFSRDDAGKFLGSYVEMGIYDRDPFQAIDQEGVGKLMEMAVKKAREVKPDIDIGICGEHGGEPTSVEFCHRIGLSNVSCSPYRVPIARLAAAQAAIKDKKK